ncbi:head completion/stabilization protein [Methylobacter sp.]|uniref:head completion/stabilization protein n=1 Tax=Methylobacter sp. TaxID=2051955 RepID=UPI003DA486E8
MSLTGKPALTTAAAITNDGFWPDLALGDLLTKYRIPAEYADDVIKTGLMMAILRVNDQLEAVKAAIVALEFTTLAGYASVHHAREVGGINALQLQYEHAVFARAKAGLLKQFNTLSRKPEAENAAKESDDTEQYWLDESQGCIKAFFDLIVPASNTLGKANARVVLL